MPNDLTAARMRELIAAATPGPWTVTKETELGCCGEDIGIEIIIPEINRVLHCSEWADSEDWDRDLANAEFIAYLATHAPALADALAKVQIYEEALIAIDRGRGGCEETHCWNVAEQALIRAAKEAAK